MIQQEGRKKERKKKLSKTKLKKHTGTKKEKKLT
jgi:hypothetical protein